jgi:hypothetical protein
VAQGPPGREAAMLREFLQELRRSADPRDTPRDDLSGLPGVSINALETIQVAKRTQTRAPKQRARQMFYCSDVRSGPEPRATGEQDRSRAS